MKIPRTRRRIIAIAAAGTAAALLASAPALAATRPADNTSAARKAIVGGHARNVILLLGDGMGDSEITIARNYHVGAAGRMAMDTLPLTGEYTTYSVQKSAPTKPDYVTDSAASGSGWATGVRRTTARSRWRPTARRAPRSSSRRRRPASARAT